ncbi:MAG: hypothetical protein SFH39_01640 [Candidatus Magnetobacterium sp. LHC-1]
MTGGRGGRMVGQWWQAGGRMTCATSLVSAVSGQCMGANVRLVPGLA